MGFALAYHDVGVLLESPGYIQQFPSTLLFAILMILKSSSTSACHPSWTQRRGFLERRTPNLAVRSHFVVDETAPSLDASMRTPALSAEACEEQTEQGKRQNKAGISHFLNYFSTSSALQLFFSSLYTNSHSTTYKLLLSIHFGSLLLSEALIQSHKHTHQYSRCR